MWEDRNAKRPCTTQHHGIHEGRQLPAGTLVHVGQAEGKRTEEEACLEIEKHV